MTDSLTESSFSSHSFTASPRPKCQRQLFQLQYRLCHSDQELSKLRRASKSHQWFRSYGLFTEGVDLAFWWSCIGKGLRLQPAQQASFLSKVTKETMSWSQKHPFCDQPMIPLSHLLSVTNWQKMPKKETWSKLKTIVQKKLQWGTFKPIHSVECTGYSLQCTVHSVKFTLYSAQCTVYSVQCTVWCTINSLQFTLC